LGEWKLVLAVPSKVYPLPTATPTDCTAAVKAATDPLNAKIATAAAALATETALELADAAALKAANAKIAAAKTALG